MGKHSRKESKKFSFIASTGALFVSALAAATLFVSSDVNGHDHPLDIKQPTTQAPVVVSSVAVQAPQATEQTETPTQQPVATRTVQTPLQTTKDVPESLDITVSVTVGLVPTPDVQQIIDPVIDIVNDIVNPILNIKGK